jgi:hypothetical protein
LLQTCSSVPSPQITRHHLPWLAQSHVTPYTCTLFFPSAGSSATPVPQTTDDLGSGYTVWSQTVICLWPAADNLRLKYIGLKCSCVLCKRVNTIIFCRVL